MLSALSQRLSPLAQAWVGSVTQLIPPNYGIVDGNAFYVTPVVVGRPPALGDRVSCEAIPNTDGGMYDWRVLRLEARPPPLPPSDKLPRAREGSCMR